MKLVENPNLKNLGVEDYTSANDMGRIFVSTIDTDSEKSKNQEKEGVPDCQKHLTLVNLFGVEFDESAERTGGAESRGVSCVEEMCMNLIPDAPCFLHSAQLTHAH